VIGLDTNVLVRYLLRDDPVQAARAERELERNERFLIDSIVLCELVWVLETGYGSSRTEIAAALERILGTAQFEIESKDLALAALDDFRRSAADFSDCLIGRRNRAAGVPETVTFDRNLKGLEGFRLLRCRRPT
jgi:predicted nucleic-acid-binding protein